MAAEKKINGTVYRFEPVVGWEAWDALDLLIKVAGPLFPILEAVVKEHDDERTIAIARMVPEILKGHDGESLRRLLEMLFASCKADGQAVTVGVKPQSLGEMFQLGAFCLEKQFGDFFGEGGLGALAKYLPGAAKSP